MSSGKYWINKVRQVNIEQLHISVYTHNTCNI